MVRRRRWLVTHVSPASMTVGGSFHVTATLSPPAGGPAPTGTVTFDVYGPGDTTCAGPVLFTSTNPLNPAGTSAVSGNFTPTTAGTYRVVATYSGDANYSSRTSVCSDPAEAVVVSKATVGLATQVSPASMTVGGSFHDTATLSPPAGGPAPTGTVTFDVYGPGDTTCAGPVLFTSTNPLNPAGTSAVSGNFTPTTAGTYRVVATYSGDANYSSRTSVCSDPAEAVVVSKATVGLATQVSPASMTVGGSFHDTATLSPPAGGPAPTGTVTFDVYGPGDTTSAGPVLFTSTNPLNPAGTSAVSGNFTPTTAGTYRVVATYSGDANYSSRTSVCSDPTEAVVVNPASPTLSTTASGTVDVGQSVTDTATLAGGIISPTGTITFRLFPNNTCTGVPSFTSTKIVAGNGMYTSDPFTPVTAGTYHWMATYSGDVNNTAAGPTVCNDPAEQVQVLPKPVIAVTKVASPPSRPEPGGTFTFTVTVSNPSTVTPVKITSLVDNVYGNLATCPGSTCGALIGVTLAPGATSPPCSFTGPFTGVGGSSQTDTVTVSGVDSHGVTATATAQATVTLTTVTPMIVVTKAASPPSRSQPGGTFTFTVQVNNPSATDPIKITKLVDNVYGDLATRPGSTCGSSIGVTLAPGATSAPCTFTGPFTGVAGATQTDTVTVTGVDSVPKTATATAQATVSITPAPQIAVTKVASPLSRPEPGGTFTFTVQVHNPSGTDPIKITSLVDNVYGNLATRPGSTCGTLIGVTLAPGATSAPCSFTGPFNGVAGASQTDTVTVSGVDSSANTATATAHATVTITNPVPMIAVTKTASPATRPAPGGVLTFTVKVNNPSATDPIKITSLVDNIYGNLATRAGSTCGSLIGVTLAPGATSAPCSFTGPFNGNAGSSQTDTVTVTGVDSHGTTATATADGRSRS